MPDLGFEVLSVAIDSRAVTPQLQFALRVRELQGGGVDTVILQCQIMIEARRRAYADGEREALLDLFGEPSRWGKTLKTMLWTRVSTSVPTFMSEVVVDLIVPCTYDLSIASAKYFVALEDGEVPLTFQFSGTVFYRDGEGALRVAPIPWSAEAAFRLPVQVWRDLMSEQYPDTAWLPLRRDLFDRLHRHRVRTHASGWDAAVQRLLEAADEGGGVARPGGADAIGTTGSVAGAT